MAARPERRGCTSLSTGCAAVLIAGEGEHPSLYIPGVFSCTVVSASAFQNTLFLLVVSVASVKSFACDDPVSEALRL